MSTAGIFDGYTVGETIKALEAQDYTIIPPSDKSITFNDLVFTEDYVPEEMKEGPRDPRTARARIKLGKYIEVSVVTGRKVDMPYKKLYEVAILTGPDGNRNLNPKRQILSYQTDDNVDDLLNTLQAQEGGES